MNTTTADGTATPARVAPRLAVVSFSAHSQLLPRGERTHELVRALARQWHIELVASPLEGAGAERPQSGRTPLRKTMHAVHSSMLLDKFELASVRRFARWQPRCDAALLIGYPFSPLVHAARRLERSGIPYALDVGDPWVLTAEQPIVRYLARIRAQRLERRLWNAAAGGIVTTEEQASALRALFPWLPLLVRPNGFAPVVASDAAPAQRRDDSTLRVAHFGNISSARLDATPFLTALAESGLWNRVELHVHGSDWTGRLRDVGSVDVAFHPSRPWAEIVADARSYDVALVIGNRDGKQLPSKAVAYAQLPIPRVAIARDAATDSLARYLADKTGWLIVSDGAGDAPALLRDHLAVDWSPAKLDPPASESWEVVAAEIATFVNRVLCTAVQSAAAHRASLRPGSVR